MSQPFVSVCMTCYDQVQFIEQAIQSAVEQNYANLQVVIGDDGSTDGTVDIVHEYAARYPERIVAIVGKPHLGLTRNCNRTLSACQGQYIAHHAGDDILLPGKIAHQVEWLEADERRTLCGHDIEAFDSESGRILYRWSDHFPLRAGRGAAWVVRNGHLFLGGSVMHRRSALPPYGFDERLSIQSDWKLWIDCLAGGGEFGYIEGIYTRYRRYPRSVSARPEMYQARMTENLMTLALVEGSYPHLTPHCRFIRARFFMALGRWHLAQGRRLAARDYWWSALRQYERVSWKVPAALVLSYLPAEIQMRTLAHFVKPSKI